MQLGHLSIADMPVDESIWVPGVNNRGDWGRWAFVELTDVWAIEGDCARKIEQVFDGAVHGAMAGAARD